MVGRRPLEERAIRLFRETYGREPELVAQAPGRVNLIGEHIDFLGGLVLPAAIDRHVAVAMAPAETWRVASATAGGEPLLRALGEELGRAPHEVGVVADLPVGLGVSSSAALLVAAAAAMAPELDGRTAALRCQRAEQRATGVMCGVMDQYASALGRSGNALLLDCGAVSHRLVPFPAQLSLAVIDSGIRRELVSTPYNQRRQEVVDAVARTGLPLAEIPSEANGPRLRHATTELSRVARFVSALERSDAEELGRLLTESHRSLRDDYQCSLPEIDAIVEAACAAEGCVGARIMGGGFGGSVLALLRAGSEARLEGAVGRPVLICQPADGAFVASPAETRDRS